MSDPTIDEEPVLYLSGGWLQAADRALADMAPLPERVVVGYRVTGGPAGAAPDGHRLVLGPDRVSLAPGLDHADLVLTLPWDLAIAILGGTAGAQRAVLDGRIAVTGDPGVLLGHQRSLADVDDRLADLRRRTIYR
jgi:hypothetical protein